MLKKASKGFAPTAINAYRNCPLKFYFSEIAGIREPDEAEDVIDPKVLGNAVHEALYKLFKPYVDTPLTVEAVEAMEKLTDTEVDNAFRDKYKGSDVQFGKNLLLVNVARMLVSRFLQSQKADIADSLGNGASITVAFLEQPFEKRIGIRYGTEVLEVKTKGFVDRIERRGGIWRILDYKTGVTESKQVRVNTWEELRYNADLNFGFQLLMYGYLLNSRFANPVTANAGTISLKKLNSGYAKVTVPENGGGGLTDRLDAGVFSEFENVLKAILEEIYDTAIPFQQTDDTAICGRCPYVNICCR
jgi:RecB family exonuclease